MNKRHAELLGTAGWAAFLHEDVLPVVTHGVDLGDDLLEIGPGPGAATEWLRHQVRRLVAIELEPEAAAALRDRFAGTNVEVAVGDATALPYPDESFDTVGMFTMLHHVPTRALQDAILAGALRALRPGGTIVTCGATSGSMPPADLNRVFFLQLSVVGSTMGTRDQLGRLVRFCEQTGVRPLIDRTMPLDQARDALAAMISGELFGKAVLTV